MGNRFDKQQLDMNQEICKHRFCGQSQVTEQAHANAYAPMIDAKSESEKLKATERLKDEESFAKRHPGLIKALIIAASLFVVGILILAAMSKVKSINGKETATGSELGDAAIKGTGKLAIVGGVLGLVGGGIAAGVSASKDSSTGNMIDEYREKSMKLAIDNHLDLQEQHGEIATRLASVNGEVAVDLAEAQGNAIVEAIESGQIPVKSEGIRLNDGFGVCNTHHMHEAKAIYDKNELKKSSNSTASNSLSDISRSSGQTITVYS